MSEQANEPEAQEASSVEGGEQAGAGEVKSPAPTPTPQQGAEPQYVTKEEFAEIQRSLSGITQFFQENFGPEEEDQPDFSQIPPEQLAYLAAQQGMAPYQPMLQAAMEEQGNRRFNELMDQHESNPEIGKVDRKLAMYAAEALIREAGGDPVKAVELGARYAAEVRKQERGEAVEEYKKSLKRPAPGADDLGAAGAGNAPVKPAKTYDEVIARWQGENEV